MHFAFQLKQLRHLWWVNEAKTPSQTFFFSSFFSYPSALLVQRVILKALAPVNPQFTE